LEDSGGDSQARKGKSAITPTGTLKAWKKNLEAGEVRYLKTSTGWERKRGPLRPTLGFLLREAETRWLPSDHKKGGFLLCEEGSKIATEGAK